MFSKACEYAIRAVVYIADQTQQENRVNIKEIAKAINSPEAFTAKILQQLVRSDILNSLKGPTGGFSIKPDRLETLNMCDVVMAIDGDDVLTGCALGLCVCTDEHPCPAHDKFTDIRDDLREMLEETSILELTKNLEKGLAFLRAK